ncbi:BCCT family transporter [Actinotalea sp. BY-33]|uniref:BCCT family transporter n=1 Tax=Actinotalea soli TaxID=2819234 RepID=A0A939LSR6_9CELL|nr:BCCT family transporter [Actinotalea soli]MBO1753198.1 BCCT family transporter [Actinotalea soli]
MQKRTSGTVFYVSVGLVVALVTTGAVAPERLSTVSGAALAWVNQTFGWFYMLATTLFVLACFFLGLGPYKHIRLSKKGRGPDYSFFTWLGLLFAARMGVGLVFWGAAEPILHYVDPPPGIEAETDEAARAALTYSVFHWALQPWGVYAIVGLALAYFKYRKGKPGLISHSLSPLLGERVEGPTGKVINIVATGATAVGVATTFGLSALQVSGGMSEIFPVPNTVVTQMVVIAVVTGLFVISSLSGVDKGIRYLSMTNLGVAIVLLSAVLVLGPTSFLLESFTTSVGTYVSDYFDLSLSLAPYSDGAWHGEWTIFFWAWVIAWAPYVGMFIARVSRGRTVQEFVLGVLLVPAVLGALWFVVIGGTALDLQTRGIADIAGPTQESEELALFLTLQSLPGGLVLSLLGLLLIVIFFVTSADSASYVLGVLSSRGSMVPSKLVRLVWGGLISATAAVLLLSGGLEALRAVAIVAALPFAVVILMMVVSLIKALRQDVAAERDEAVAEARPQGTEARSSGG